MSSWAPPDLIRQMARDNISWGEERIANELRLKLGVQISPRTVRKYMPKRPPGTPRGDQRWLTFVHNHARAIVACDFLTVVTATFKCLYVFLIIELEHASFSTSTSRTIPRRRGRCSSFAKRSPQTVVISICFVTAIRSIPPLSTIRTISLACGF